MNTKIPKLTLYVVRALYRRKKYGSYQYEWREMRSFGVKKEAVDYAKRESKISYRDGRTGRYMIQKQTNEGIYENGKLDS